MLYRVNVDWVSMTGKVNKNEGDHTGNALSEVSEYAREMFRNLGIFDTAIKTVPPPKYYSYAFEDTKTGARINFGENLAQQGWQLVISGSACKTLDNVQVLENFRELYRAKVTRFDFALDLFYSDIQIAIAADPYVNAGVPAGKKNASYIKGKTGDTFYLGSRSSDKMLRFYDKGAEQRVPIDWKRAEMEFKGAAAGWSFGCYLDNPMMLIGVMKDFMGDVVTPLRDALLALETGEVAMRAQAPRVVTDRERWLRGQVLASFQKLCLEDRESAGRVLDDLLEVWVATGLWDHFNSKLDGDANKRDNQG